MRDSLVYLDQSNQIDFNLFYRRLDGRANERIYFYFYFSFFFVHSHLF